MPPMRVSFQTVPPPPRQRIAITAARFACALAEFKNQIKRSPPVCGATQETLLGGSKSLIFKFLFYFGSLILNATVLFLNFSGTAARIFKPLSGFNVQIRALLPASEVTSAPCAQPLQTTLQSSRFRKLFGRGEESFSTLSCQKVVSLMKFQMNQLHRQQHKHETHRHHHNQQQQQQRAPHGGISKPLPHPKKFDVDDALSRPGPSAAAAAARRAILFAPPGAAMDPSLHAHPLFFCVLNRTSAPLCFQPRLPQPLSKCPPTPLTCQCSSRSNLHRHEHSKINVGIARHCPSLPPSPFHTPNSGLHTFATANAWL
jgi:hypothetical protein